jgi:hypothetical protein
MIVPLSLSSTERMKPLQSFLFRKSRYFWLSFFDVYPCKLFDGSKQRLIIATSSGAVGQTLLLSTKYNRWKPEERDDLVNKLQYFSTSLDTSRSVIPKFDSPISLSIKSKIESRQPIPLLETRGKAQFYVHRIPYNYVKAIDFIPYFWNQVDGEKKSEDYKPYQTAQLEDYPVVLAALNSNLFFWWWYLLFEGYHCGRHEIASFKLGLAKMPVEYKDQLTKLSSALMSDMVRSSERKTCSYKTTGKVIYDEFYPRLSKSITDEIDRVLAEHYGFTDEELDFIINYDIKYRMGKDADDCED